MLRDQSLRCCYSDKNTNSFIINVNRFFLPTFSHWMQSVRLAHGKHKYGWVSAEKHGPTIDRDCICETAMSENTVNNDVCESCIAGVLAEANFARQRKLQIPWTERYDKTLMLLQSIINARTVSANGNTLIGSACCHNHDIMALVRICEIRFCLVRYEKSPYMHSVCS